MPVSPVAVVTAGSPTAATTQAASNKTADSSNSNNNNNNNNKNDSGTAAPLQKSALAKLLLIAHGLGILLGFATFYSLYRSQCHVLLTKVASEHNSTLMMLQSQWTATTSSSHNNNNNNNLDQQQHQDRSWHQLEQQTALARQHQDLLHTHEATVRRVSDLQQDQTDRQHEVARLTAAVAAAEANVQDAERKGQQQVQRLSVQLELAKTMMQEKVEEVEELKEWQRSTEEDDDDDACACDGNNSGNSSSSSEDSSNTELLTLTTAIRRRRMALTPATFGPGPVYTVLLLLKKGKGSGTSSSIELEWDVRHPATPHASLHTFLTLVQAKLYHDTTLAVVQGSESNRVVKLMGGTPTTSQSARQQSKLTRAYAELGWSSGNALWFVEEHSSDYNGNSNLEDDESCRAVVHFGGTVTSDFVLQVRTTSTKEKEGKDHTDVDSNHKHTLQCPGRIVSGLDIFDDLHSGDRLTIVDARIVPNAAAADQKHREL